MQGREKSPEPESEVTFLTANFVTEEMYSFQDRPDAIVTPNRDSLSDIFRVFERKRMSGKFLFSRLETRQH